MNSRRRRHRRGNSYWLDIAPSIALMLLIGISALTPLFIMRYVKEVEEMSKFVTLWRPWYERDRPGAYLDDELDSPRILLWSVPSLEWEKDKPLPQRGERELQFCPARDDHKTCFATRDRDYLKRTDAVLFDAHNLTYYDYPPVRHQRQVWVIRTRGDPPLNPSYDLLSMAAKFNWTMSYRADADVTVPYRTWDHLPMKVSHEIHKQVGKKRRIAVWLVSKCEAEQVSVVATIKKVMNDFEYADFVAHHTDARIIEDCGGEACKNRHECLKILAETYFFLFVVESSPCFENPHQLMFDALQYSLVPVYFGRSPLGRTVPPTSVFDATAGTSSKNAFDIVLNIFKYKHLYMDLMQWKEQYGIVVPRNDLCALCDALYENRSHTTNDDVVEWWSRGSECKKLYPYGEVYPFEFAHMGGIRPGGNT